MPLQVLLVEFDLTILTYHLSVRLLIMLILLLLGDDFTASSALVVTSSAADLMDPKLRRVYHFLACAAFFSLYSLPR